MTVASAAAARRTPSRSLRRIALVAACPFPSPQGSQVFVGQMARHLATAGHEVHLLTYGQGSGLAPDGVVHHRIARLPGDDSSRSGPNLAKPFLDVLLAQRLARIVRERRIDVVHAHNYEAAVAALAARMISGAPVVYHSHNLMGDELETYFAGGVLRRFAAGIGRMLDAQVPPRADRTIALCDWSARALVAAGCQAEKITVIAPAVEDDGALPDGATARRALGIGDGDFVVGYVGNLDTYQNLELLVAAMSRLIGNAAARGAGGRPRLLVVTHGGGAPLRPLLAAAGLEAGLEAGLKAGLKEGQAAIVVEDADFEQVRRAMAASDVLALPRRLGSGYPVKLLNYMSAAKAVVSAGCGSKVLTDGVDAVVVEDDDAQAFAAALVALREDPRRRKALGEAARRRFLAGMTWQAVLPRIEAVYDGLREAGGRSGETESQ
ncbi:MAG TPA: glycosyltransferase family 4 protein [Candidatus Binatia bacterium]